ncbi:MAG: hypothetical protein QOH32_3370 [Bradyrhizobium sp.]|jgi:uncharacterized phiE125 gp8 family phage protein|nr:hypothetical protein [Bradyrhizobium sp.]
MPAILLIPPSAEPWSVTEAKAFLRVEHDDDDAVIAALIAAARGHVEALSRRALLVQRWRCVLDAWPANGRLDPRVGPLRSVIAARVYDHGNTAHAIDAGTFVVDAAANVIASPCRMLPLPGRRDAGIELDVELGYGTTAGDVPEPLRHAIRLLVAHWYENRGLAAIGGNVAMLPAGVGALVAPFRMLSL